MLCNYYYYFKGEKWGVFLNKSVLKCFKTHFETHFKIIKKLPFFSFKIIIIAHVFLKNPKIIISHHPFCQWENTFLITCMCSTLGNFCQAFYKVLTDSSFWRDSSPNPVFTNVIWFCFLTGFRSNSRLHGAHLVLSFFLIKKNPESKSTS